MTNPITPSTTIPVAPNLEDEMRVSGPIKILKSNLYQNAAVQKEIEDKFHPNIWTRISNIASLIVNAVKKFFKLIGDQFSDVPVDERDSRQPGFSFFSLSALKRKVWESEHAPHSPTLDTINSTLGVINYLTSPRPTFNAFSLLF